MCMRAGRVRADSEVRVATNLTTALAALNSGDDRARDRVLALVFAELKAIAHAHLAGERPGHGLQTTMLVDDAFMRLVGGDASFENRRHFFGAAAEAIRRILIDHARAMSAVKRGGRMGRTGIDLDALPRADTSIGEWEALEAALAKLEAMDPREAEVVRLRFFAGLSEEQVAAAIGVTDRTVRRDWVHAKAWLKAELASGGGGA